MQTEARGSYGNEDPSDVPLLPLGRAGAEGSDYGTDSHDVGKCLPSPVSNYWHEKWLLQLILFTVFMALLCDYTLNCLGIPILPMFLRRLHLPPADGGVLFAAKPAAQIVGNVFAGFVVSSAGAPQVLLVGLLVLVLSTVMSGTVISCAGAVRGTFCLLVVAATVQGLSSALIMASGMTWIAESHSKAQRGMAMSLALVGVGAGAMSGGAFGGLLAALGGDATPYLAMAGLLLINLMLAAAAARVDPATGHRPAPRRTPSDLQATLRLCLMPPVRRILLLVLVSNIGIAALQPTLPLRMHDQFGFSQAHQGLLWGALSLAYLVARPVSTTLGARCRLWRVITFGILILSAGLVAVTCQLHAWIVIVGVILVGVGVACVTTPCMPLLADIVEQHRTDQYGALYSAADAATSLGMIGGPLVGTTLCAAWSFEVAFRVIALCSLAAVFCSYSLHQVEGEDHGPFQDRPML